MRVLIAALLLAAPVAAHAGDRAPGAPAAARTGDGVPDQLDRAEQDAYRAVFKAIRDGRWADAQRQLDAMKPGLLHPIALAELYTARGSPKVALDPLLALLKQAPDLPQAEQLARLAKLRGATDADLPDIPVEQRLTWYDAAPVRRRAHSIKSDNAATEIALAIQPFVKNDDGPQAEALVESHAADLTPEALTEWRQKVAWIYYLANDDANARRLAAVAQSGEGDWVAQADWVQGLAAWRQHDCAAAGTAFQSVAQHAGDTELRSAGLYWQSRASMACGHPERVQDELQSAAQYGESFYGLLARQALGILDSPTRGEAFVAADWRALDRRPNVRVAAALTEIGEHTLADEVMRHQAKIGDPGDYQALTRLAGRIDLPATQLWLSHYCPPGEQPLASARYPMPDWTPDGGWRVDRALVFAHTLQESRFNTDIRSAAGAMGLMQVKMGAATDIGRRHGVTYVSSDLTKPSTNMEIGQSYLEQLRDLASTQGLLPKVIAAYNAGPTPVEAWNSLTKDEGDPLLYIESIPYWETRGYVMTVLRNYWMYERQEGKASDSRSALAQGLWPKFPGLPGAKAVKLSSDDRPVPRQSATGDTSGREMVSDATVSGGAAGGR